MKTGSFVDTILLHVCPHVALRRGRVSAIFYGCMELQTLVLAIGKVNTNFGDEAFRQMPSNTSTCEHGTSGTDEVPTATHEQHREPSSHILTRTVT